MALAAATAPLDGTELRLAAWPAEITTMCLPFAAGRDVGSTGRLVPCSAFAVAAWAAARAADAPPDELLLDEPPAVDEDFELLEHAARTAATARTTTPLRATLTMYIPPVGRACCRGIVGGIVSVVTYHHTMAARLAEAFGHIAGGEEPRRWAASGAMALTGDADRPPLLPSAPVAGVMAAAGAMLGELAPGVVDDAPALLGERAALAGLTRHGRVSCGGATRLLPAADGWAAVALARADDWAAVDAWLGCDSSWDALAAALAGRPIGEAVERARLLSIPVAAVPSRAPARESPWLISAGGCPAERRAGRPLVVDLSALWAGPLCADLWARTGARVLKVEDPSRPDGARQGDAGFFTLLNATKRPVSAPLASTHVRRLLREADVVITSGRRRAFDQAGIDVQRVLEESPTVWVAITGYGWSGDTADRVGFGDDTAAGAGLVALDPSDGEPRFVADAVADPLCGTLAAVASLAAYGEGGSWLIDAALSRAAGYVAGLGTGERATAAAGEVLAQPPRARRG